jgi:ubiquinone/menaquinone biosynthesis C-methylase UbiE
MILTRSQAQAFYDHFGAKQDAQAFYEDAALDELIAHGAFDQAENVFELGCGTGRFALRLFTNYLTPSASYIGIDLSRTMVKIAQQRLSVYAARARLVQSDGALHLPLVDHSVDRVVSTYVLDLLSDTDIQQIVSEAYRVLTPGGKLCLVSLTNGETFASRIVSVLWSTAFRLQATLVGGCRPIRLETCLDTRLWSIDHHKVVTQYGVPSEVLIASQKHIGNNVSHPGKPGSRPG